MAPSRTQAIVIISISVVFLFMQFVGIRFLFNFGEPKYLEEKSPWDAIKLLVTICERSGLPVFVIEPSLLRALREGSARRMELWNQETHTSVAIGVRESGLDQMHLVMSAMKHHGYQHWEKVDPDPRGLSLSFLGSFRVVTTHILLWVPVQAHTPMLIHLVIFYKREGYFWHAKVTDKLQTPPFDLSHSLFGKTAGAYNLFDLVTVTIDGVKVQHPNDTYLFINEMGSSEFVECNYTRAYMFHNEYKLNKAPGIELFKRKARQLLYIAKNVLDSMEIPFWLSSGTCLGWFRQCDLISHTTDVDIGIFIKDYREELVSLMEGAGLKLTHYLGKVSDSLELSFLYGDLKLDIFFFYKQDAENYIWNGGTQASTGLKYKYIFPPFSLCWTEFLEMWIRTPCPAGAYINANYGSRWMIPDKKWDWKSSPHNVIENGKWPESEWDEVIQLYE